MRHIVSVLLENEPGALSRVVGLFSARGYNIETLTVAPTEDGKFLRIEARIEDERFPVSTQIVGSDDAKRGRRQRATEHHLRVSPGENQ